MDDVYNTMEKGEAGVEAGVSPALSNCPTSPTLCAKSTTESSFPSKHEQGKCKWTLLAIDAH